MIKFCTTDTRESILVDNLVVPTGQILSRKLTVFGWCVYERRVNYTDAINKECKNNVKGFAK